MSNSLIFRLLTLISLALLGLLSFLSHDSIYLSESSLDLASTKVGTVLCTSLILVLWLKFLIKEKISDSAMAVLFYCFAILVFYKATLFFFWDEWHLIERFKNDGIGASFVGHNEHFIPISFLAYFFQLKLFGDDYCFFLYLSSAIHAFNSVLLLKILRILGRNFSKIEGIARTIAFMFLVSALHSEALHWAFEQCLLISASFTFLAVLHGLEYTQTSRRRSLVLAAIFCALSPLCFGNGFIVVLFIFCIALREYLHAGRLITKEIKYLLLACSLAMLIPVALYAGTTSNSEGHGLGVVAPIESNKQVAKYLIYGTQLGTVVRGLGLYPGLLYGDSREFFNAAKDTPLLNPTSNFNDPENLFFYLGVYISLGSLVILIRRYRPGDSSLSLWFAGQCWMVAAFLLLTYGRSAWGYHNSLTLRYQYTALPGLCIFIIPVLALFAGNLKKPAVYWSAQVFCCFYFFMQLTLVGGYKDFTSKGIANKVWLKTLEKRDSSVPISLTPGLYPNDIRTSLKWMREENWQVLGKKIMVPAN